MGLHHLVRDFALAIADAAAGRTRRRYEHGIDIAAPPEIVWDMLKSRDLEFDGHFPMRVTSEAVPGRPGHEIVRVEAGTVHLQMLTRIVDERPGEAILFQLLPEGTDPALLEGDDDYVGFVLTETPRGTRLDLTRETSPRRSLSRLTVPIGLRSGARRYKRKAEAILLERLGQGPEATGA